MQLQRAIREAIVDTVEVTGRADNRLVYSVGTCESEIFVRIESRIESGCSRLRACSMPITGVV